MASSYAIHDETTGEILHVIIGGSDLVAANLNTGEAALDVDGALPAGDDQYVDDPGGTPTLATRPDFASVIPETVTEGTDLLIPDVPDGATVVITSTGSGGGTHTKSGGLGTLDAAITGAADGDVLTVDISLWPYRPMSGSVLVVAL